MFIFRLTRPYDYRTLIHLFVELRRRDLPDAFREYYGALFAKLEELLGVRLSGENSPEGAMLGFMSRSVWSLFRNTADSLLAIRTPLSPYLEATLLIRHLERSGDEGKRALELLYAIGDGARESETRHRELLETLFRQLFRDVGRVVTSAELLAAGFDDTAEPDWRDFDDD